MSNWNPAIGQVMMTTPMDVTTVIQPDKRKIRVGSSCEANRPEARLTNELFGVLESIVLEMIWDEHPQFPDRLFRNQTLSSMRILKFLFRFY